MNCTLTPRSSAASRFCVVAQIGATAEPRIFEEQGQSRNDRQRDDAGIELPLGDEDITDEEGCGGVIGRRHPLGVGEEPAEQAFHHHRQCEGKQHRHFRIFGAFGFALEHQPIEKRADGGHDGGCDRKRITMGSIPSDLKPQ